MGSSEQNDGTSVPFSEPKLCSNNCGFWGNPATMNLCSKCYKDVCLKEERTAVAKAAVESSFNTAAAVSSVVQDSALPAEEKTSDGRSAAAVSSVVQDSALTAEEKISDGQSAAAAAAKGGNRCGTCNKKVGLVGFKCRCGSKFCGDHRYPESHGCWFDYKSAGRDAIAKANPLVKADKVERF